MRRWVLAIIGCFLLTACGAKTPNEELKDSEESSTTEETQISSESLSPEKQIDRFISQLSLEEKIGQLFFVRVPPENAEADITTYHLGGLVVFGQDFEDETTTSFRQKMDRFQEAAAIPLLLGSDEEGGLVSRISYAGFVTPPFASPQSLYQAGGMQAVIDDVDRKAEVIKELGLNVNLAPVADVSQNPNSFIYDRTIGLDAAGTADYVKQVVTQMEKDGLGNTLKHFPGYGDSEDSHIDIVYDERALAEVKADFLPFQAGIEAGADSILVAHNIVTSIDDTQPASISPKAHQLLRDELQFEGVVMTDDLDMAGISDFTGQDQAALKAILAGNDLVMTSHYSEQIPYVLTAIKSGELTETQVDQSVKRVLKWKYDLGIWQP